MSSASLMCLAEGLSKDESSGHYVFSGHGSDMFSKGALKDESCGAADVFSGRLGKDESCGPSVFSRAQRNAQSSSELAGHSETKLGAHRSERSAAHTAHQSENARRA